MRNRVDDLKQHNGINGHAPSQTGQNGWSPDPTAQLAPVREAVPGHTSSGRFAPGNKLGKGNPFARRLGKLRSAFLDAITDADVAAVARKLQELAMAGDVAAATLYLSYALGKPVKVVDVDRLELDEFALLDAAPTTARVLAIMADSADPATAAANIRNFVPTDPAKARDAMFEQAARSPQSVLDERKARCRRPPRV
jgi:hypothetical protein